MSSTRTCVTCVWMRRDNDAPTCAHPRAWARKETGEVQADKAVGEELRPDPPIYPSCFSQRYPTWWVAIQAGKCGRSGRWWEPVHNPVPNTHVTRL